MATLKRKVNGGWETVAGADEFPVDVPVQVTEVDANLTILTATENKSYTPVAPYNGYSRVDVNVAGGLPSVIRAGNTPAVFDEGSFNATGTSLVDTGLRLTIPRDGTYRIMWTVAGGSSSYTVKSRLVKNGTDIDSQRSCTGTQTYMVDLELEEGDVMSVNLSGYSVSGAGTFGGCGGFAACIDWDIWGD